jgi:hypothetical protein
MKCKRAGSPRGLQDFTSRLQGSAFGKKTIESQNKHCLISHPSQSSSVPKLEMLTGCHTLANVIWTLLSRGSDGSSLVPGHLVLLSASAFQKTCPFPAIRVCAHRRLDHHCITTPKAPVLGLNAAIHWLSHGEQRYDLECRSKRGNYASHA